MPCARVHRGCAAVVDDHAVSHNQRTRGQLTSANFSPERPRSTVKTLPASGPPASGAPGTAGRLIARATASSPAPVTAEPVQDGWTSPLAGWRQGGAQPRPSSRAGRHPVREQSVVGPAQCLDDVLGSARARPGRARVAAVVVPERDVCREPVQRPTHPRPRDATASGMALSVRRSRISAAGSARAPGPVDLVDVEQGRDLQAGQGPHEDPGLRPGRPPLRG